MQASAGGIPVAASPELAPMPEEMTLCLLATTAATAAMPTVLGSARTQTTLSRLMRPHMSRRAVIKRKHCFKLMISCSLVLRQSTTAVN